MSQTPDADALSDIIGPPTQHPGAVHEAAADADFARELEMLLHRMRSRFDGASIADELVLALVPRRIDPDQFLAVLSGSEHLAPVIKPTAKSSQTDRRSPRGMLAKALRDQQAMQGRERDLERRLTDAREERQRQDDAVIQAEQDVAQINSAALKSHLVDVTAALFLMGPAWTIMRAVSPHLQRDIALEESFTQEQQDYLRRHREERPRLANQLLDLLDRHSGDLRLETKLFIEILRVVTAHDEQVNAVIADKKSRGEKLSPLERRVRRSRAEMQASARDDVPVSDAVDVLRGFAEDDG